MEIHTTAILIYPNIVNTLAQKCALGQCPAPKIYPHIHKRNILLYPNIINTLVRKYALGHCPGPKIYPHIHKLFCHIHHTIF